MEQAVKPFALAANHVLLPQASMLAEVDQEVKTLLTSQTIKDIISLIPDDWLMIDAPFETPALHREAYVQFLETRLAHSEIFVKDAQHARTTLI
jgi:hypothetical protein